MKPELSKFYFVFILKKATIPEKKKN